MTNFVANVQWDINQVDLSLYADHQVGFGSQQGVGFTFNGTNYPDRFFVEAQDGSINRFIYAYGDFSVNALGVPSSGTFNALEEFDVNTSSTRWFADGFSVSASQASSAASSGDFLPLVINQLGGNDTITLSPFDDVMEGYGGNDTMKGGGGNDTMDGGTGSDTAIFDGSFASATITFDGPVIVISTPTDGTDRLTNFEFVNFNGDVRSVTSLNGPPVPSAKTDSATEDGPVIMGQLAATDPDGDPITYSEAGSGLAGLTINPDGSYSFNPSGAAYQSVAQGQTFQAKTSFSVSDGFNTAISTLTIAVSGVNDGPEVAPTAQFEAAANTTQDFSVSGSDIDGDTLTYTASDPANGMVTGGENGQFTYTPDPGFSGMDSFSVTVSDGKGGSAPQALTVIVSPQNGTPVPSPATATAVEDGAIVTGQLVATDPEGDPLTFSPLLTGQFAPGVAGLVINSNGSYSFDPSHADYQDLAQDETAELLAGYFVSDGALSASSTLTITITGVNDAPVFDPGIMEIATTVDSPKDFSVTATDIDGDTLIFSAADPDNGSVTVGEDGQFTYTPDPGFIGTDSVEVMVSDGNGGTDMRTLVVTVSDLIPELSEWNFLLTDGFVGEVGGYGKVFGTAGFQDITVLDLPGAVVFDPSFNRQGNIVRLSGDADEWAVVRSNSSAVFSKGETFVQLPGGIDGVPIVFDDGTRTLFIDQGEGTFKIGDQAFDDELVQLSGPADNPSLPTGADADAVAKLLFFANGSATVSGKVDAFGAAGFETLTFLSGSGDLDPSFNRGGDKLIFDGPAGDFLANLDNSSVFLDNGVADVTIPAGPGGMTLAFTGDDERLLVLDTSLGQILIGDQQIGVEAAALMAIV